MTKRSRFGALGTFSRGKMNAQDEGDLAMGIANNGREVIINFGKPVAWIGFEPDKAEELAKMLISHAQQVRGKSQ